jgi:DNA-binding XRE family transcriptional regulator
MVLMTTSARHDADDTELFRQLNDVRAEALRHAREARRLSAERRILIHRRLEAGYSQADIAREMGVARQVVQKMLVV